MTLDFPELVIDRKGVKTQLGISIPKSYNPSTPIPLFVFMKGGDGGNNASHMGIFEKRSLLL